MKINFNQGLENLNKEVLEDEKGAIITLKTIAVQALLTPMPGESVSAEDKVNRYKIANIIHSSEDEIDLKVADVNLLQELIGKMHTPIIVGQVFEMLEG